MSDDIFGNNNNWKDELRGLCYEIVALSKKVAIFLVFMFLVALYIHLGVEVWEKMFMVFLAFSVIGGVFFRDKLDGWWQISVFICVLLFISMFIANAQDLTWTRNHYGEF